MGSGRKGKSGIENSQKNIETPTEIPCLSNIEQISCGRDFCLSIDSNNQVYSWGDNNFGQLGESEDFMVETPKRLRFFKDKKIVKISSGENFSLALSQNGEVYSWGINSDGQLGHGHKSDVKIPNKINLKFKVSDIGCGNSHSLLLSGKINKFY